MDYLVDGGPIQPSSSGCMRNIGNTRIVEHPRLLQDFGHQQYHSTQRKKDIFGFVLFIWVRLLGMRC